MTDSELAQLIRLLPPPQSPTKSPEDWTAVERSLGIDLPSDYKQFIQSYGSGSIDNLIWVYNAIDAEAEQFSITIQKNLEQFRIISESGFEVPYRLFPEPGGLVPWGASDFGHMLMWRTTGAPDEWDIVVSADYCREFHEFDGMSMTMFLVELLEGENPKVVTAFGHLDLSSFIGDDRLG